MADIRKGGYGSEQAGPADGGPCTPEEEALDGCLRCARSGALRRAYYGVERKRFLSAILAILCILAVLFVIGLVKYGVKDTHPITYPKPPTVSTTVYVPPPRSCFPRSAGTAERYPPASGRRVGKRTTSRMLAASASSMTNRSTPMPRPAVGGRPYSMARR